MPSKRAAALAFSRHDHDRCRNAAIGEAREACEARGLRLTPVRQRVLEILLESHEAMGAYDVLRRLTEEGAGPQPPTAYRALDFLVANGFAHRVEKLNAYIACTAAGRSHSPVFMICRDCKGVAELGGADIHDSLRAAAGAIGFSIDRTVLEAEGTCPACRAREARQ